MSDRELGESLAPALAPAEYLWTRALFLRAVGFIYTVAFVSLAVQLGPLFAKGGVLPVAGYLERLRAAGVTFWVAPSLFWWRAGDGVLTGACAVGLALSLAVLGGVSNALVLAALWALYLSFVHVGQIFYGYGWEILLLETGFLAVFLAPWTALRPRAAPPAVTIFLVRWLLFRVLFGAGLIKIRGDACWRDLTCLLYHYETQPIPSPLSWLIHQAPPWLHAAGVLYNHFVELVVPFFLFGPRRVARVAGLFEVAFQLFLILSGNLSWLNWLTLALCICCFDDHWLARLVPGRWRRAAPLPSPSRRAKIVAACLGALVAGLSVAPVANLLSESQVMNTSFEPLHLVNTYGAFGSVGRVRHEVILEGTDAAAPDERAVWRPYEFPCKPGDPARRPCVIAPFQPRLDWQIWFAAFQRPERQGWLLQVVAHLLAGDRRLMRLFANDPFAAAPPRFIRAELYEYHFTRWGERGWWTRRRVGPYLPPLGRDHPALQGLDPDLDDE